MHGESSRRVQIRFVDHVVFENEISEWGRVCIWFINTCGDPVLCWLVVFLIITTGNICRTTMHRTRLLGPSSTRSYGYASVGTFTILSPCGNWARPTRIAIYSSRVEGLLCKFAQHLYRHDYWPMCINVFLVKCCWTHWMFCCLLTSIFMSPWIKYIYNTWV